MSNHFRSRNRKRKYVVWLHNKTDRRDDEWLAVWTTSRAKAKQKVEDGDVYYDDSRFFLGDVYTALQFRRMMGFGA